MILALYINSSSEQWILRVGSYWEKSNNEITEIRRDGTGDYIVICQLVTLTVNSAHVVAVEAEREA